MYKNLDMGVQKFRHHASQKYLSTCTFAKRPFLYLRGGLTLGLPTREGLAFTGAQPARATRGATPPAPPVRHPGFAGSEDEPANPGWPGD